MVVDGCECHWPYVRLLHSSSTKEAWEIKYANILYKPNRPTGEESFNTPNDLYYSTMSQLKFEIEVRLIIFTFLQRPLGSVCQFLRKLSYIRSLKFWKITFAWKTIFGKSYCWKLSLGGKHSFFFHTHHIIQRTNSKFFQAKWTFYWHEPIVVVIMSLYPIKSKSMAWLQNQLYMKSLVFRDANFPWQNLLNLSQPPRSSIIQQHTETSTQSRM